MVQLAVPQEIFLHTSPTPRENPIELKKICPDFRSTVGTGKIGNANHLTLVGSKNCPSLASRFHWNVPENMHIGKVRMAGLVTSPAADESQKHHNTRNAAQ